MSPCLADQTADVDYLNTCIKQLPAQQKPGLTQLAITCPELRGVLDDAAVAEQLPENWETTLGPAGLRDISSLLERYRGQPRSGAAHPDSVHAIAQALRVQPPPRGWWQRLGEWLRNLLARQRSGDPGLLDKFLNGIIDGLTPRRRQALLYGSLALVLLLVGFIVWRELRASGMGRRTAKRASPDGMDVPMGRSGDLALGALDSAARSDQPSLLLRLLVQALRRTGRLAGERTLTHRELIHQAGFEHADQQQRFAGVSLCAEQQLYGHTGSAAGGEAEFERVMREGRELYLQLLALGSAKP